MNNSFSAKTSTLLAIASILVTGFSQASAPQPVLEPGAPAAAKKWKVTFQDEFDGKTLDPKVWHPEINVSNTDSAFVQDKMRLDGEGRLEFNVKRNTEGKFERAGDWAWTGQGFTQRFGYFETRVRFHQKPGFNAAFWLYPVNRNSVNPFAPDGGIEVDIFEDGFNWKPGTMSVQQTIWIDAPLQDVGGNAKGMKAKYDVSRPFTAYESIGRYVNVDYTPEEWAKEHVVGFEWTPLEYIFYIDGKVTGRWNYKECPVSISPLMMAVGMYGPMPKEYHTRNSRALEESNYEDKAVFDYVRVWTEDVDPQLLPQVTLDLKPATLVEGASLSVPVRAKAGEGTLSKILLFSNGRLLGEAPVSGAEAVHTFEVPQLFVADPHTLAAMAVDAAGRVGVSTTVDVSVVPGVNGVAKESTPYLGQPQTIPGVIKASFYDEGGQYVAYFDKGDDNKFAKAPTDFRAGEGVDCTPGSIGWIQYGEWMKYTVDVKEAGRYDASVRLSRADTSIQQGPVTVEIAVDGKPPAISTLETATGGWDNIKTIPADKPLELSAGRHVLKVRFFGKEVNFYGLTIEPSK